MKNRDSVVLAVLLLIGLAYSNSVFTQSQQVGSIGGVVEDRDQKDGGRTLGISLTSDKLFNDVTIKLTEKLNNAVEAVRLPEGCAITKDKDKLKFNNCPPTFDFNTGLRFPKSSIDELDKIVRKPMEISVDSTKVKIPVRKVPPVVLTKPSDAAEIPEIIRTGFDFSISPKEGFTDGDWEGSIIDEDGATRKMFVPDEADPRNPFLEYSKDPEKTFEALKTKGLGEFEDPYGADLPYGELSGGGDSFELDQKFDFEVPDKTKEIWLRYTDPYGQVLVDGKVDAVLIQDTNPNSLTTRPRLTDCSKKIFLGDKLCICGFFPDSYVRNSLLLDGKPLGPPLAGSTESIIVLPKGLTIGKHVISWNIPTLDGLEKYVGVSWKLPSAEEKVEFVVLGVEASIDQNKLFTGQGTVLRLKITGTEEKLPIEFENKTPGIIDLEGGTKQVISTSGGVQNTVERKVKGTKRGTFDIKYKLDVPPCPCNPVETQRSITAEVIEVADKLKEKPPVKPLAPTIDNPAETDACEEIRGTCREIGRKIEAIILRRNKEIEECEKRPEADRQNCIANARMRWDPIIKDGEQKFDECVKRFKSCRLREVALRSGGNSAIRREFDKLSANCDSIEDECQLLVVRKKKLKRVLAKKKAKCLKNVRTKAGADNCVKNLNGIYRPKIDEVQKRLDECRKRLDDCRKGIKKDE
ncbi:MAG: hypothetical protein KDB79_07625 [Acidobacteria bacterium]|nr:hypothetical protein [Acidobacteriota bacterium]